MNLHQRSLQILENTTVQDLRIEEVGQEVDAIKGIVSDHCARKRLFLSALEQAERPVINELSVRCVKAFNPLQLLGELKRDPYLAGVTFSLGQSLRYQSTFHVTCFTGSAGEITLNGRVPSKAYRAYLETKLWLAAGISRVINLTSSATINEPEPNAAEVLRKLIETEAKLDSNISAAISAKAEKQILHLQGHVGSHALLQELEHDAWAIPMVLDVQNEVRVVH